MESINVLIEKILLKNSRKYYRMILYELEVNGDFISQNFKKDCVNEENLLNVLNKSIKNEYIKLILLDALFLIDESSITDKVFERCLKYPGRYRKTLLIQLAHIFLKKEQLEKLNQILETPEAFYKLFLIHLCDNDFSVVQLQEFMLKNEKFLSEIANYKEHLIGYSISQDKINLADQLIDKSFSKIKVFYDFK